MHDPPHLGTISSIMAIGLVGRSFDGQSPIIEMMSAVIAMPDPIKPGYRQNETQSRQRTEVRLRLS
jgi:hypothetical protein